MLPGFSSGVPTRMTRFVAAFVFLLALLAGAIAQERTVNVYNWSDYVDPKVLEDFTRQTGIKVVYDTYDNNEIVETKLLAGKSGYDIVVPSGPLLQRLGQAPLNTWDIVMRPEFIGKLKDCGVQMLDAPEDIFPGILNYLGLNPDSKRNEDLTRAGDALFRIRGSIQKFHSSEYINALANGDICMAVGYSGDVLQARRRAEEAKNGIEIAYLIPRDGTLMWFDSFAIPADAANVNEAHEFINYMMRPEVAAANTNFVSYASGNLAARKLVNREILENPGVYPDEATFKRLFTNTAYDERSQRTLTRLWTRVKTGR